MAERTVTPRLWWCRPVRPGVHRTGVLLLVIQQLVELFNVVDGDQVAVTPQVFGMSKS
jgi:hypothetical protein